MSGKLRVSSDRRQIITTPFEVHWGTTAPLDSLGNDDDIYIRTGDVEELFYKKRAGSWVASGGGGGFSGWSATNSEIFDKSANFTSVVATNFTITTTAKLTVEKDGVKVYEGYGWTRNTGTNAIDFDDEILASADSKILVFVGRYS